MSCTNSPGSTHYACDCTLARLESYELLMSEISMLIDEIEGCSDRHGSSFLCKCCNDWIAALTPVLEKLSAVTKTEGKA